VAETSRYAKEGQIVVSPWLRGPGEGEGEDGSGISCASGPAARCTYSSIPGSMACHVISSRNGMAS
jgi:hypothetical protein